jgi:hypothetical protein
MNYDPMFDDMNRDPIKENDKAIKTAFIVTGLFILACLSFIATLAVIS